MEFQDAPETPEENESPELRLIVDKHNGEITLEFPMRNNDGSTGVAMAVFTPKQATTLGWHMITAGEFAETIQAINKLIVPDTVVH